MCLHVSVCSVMYTVYVPGVGDCCQICFVNHLLPELHCDDLQPYPDNNISSGSRLCVVCVPGVGAAVCVFMFLYQVAPVCV